MLHRYTVELLHSLQCTVMVYFVYCNGMFQSSKAEKLNGTYWRVGRLYMYLVYVCNGGLVLHHYTS